MDTKFDENGEILCVQVTPQNQKPLSVLVKYRPPGSHVLTALNNIKSLVRQYQLIYPNSEYIWIGDVNVDLLKKGTPNTKALLNIAGASNMKQHLFTPTRVIETSSSLIDIVFANITHVAPVLPIGTLVTTFQQF